jgi:valyl-tRNA synthetase
MASPGRDIKLAEERIEGYRNFANKLWNAARFILLNLEETRQDTSVADGSTVGRWITSRLQRCIGEVNTSLEAYRFDEAANTLYHFIWHEYCDWYLELAKPGLSEKQSPLAAQTRTTLVRSFETILRLLHPFMPFITEEIWQTIPHQGESVMVAPYPSSEPGWINEDIEQEIESVQKVVSAVRDIRGVQGIAPSRKLTALIALDDGNIQSHIERNQNLVTILAGLSRLTIAKHLEPPVHAAAGTVVFSGSRLGQLYIDLAGIIDVAKERTRIEKRLKELSLQLEQTQKKLANPEFVAKVPAEVLEKTRARHEESRLEAEKLSKELLRLRNIDGKTS